MKSLPTTILPSRKSTRAIKPKRFFDDDDDDEKKWIILKKKKWNYLYPNGYKQFSIYKLSKQSVYDEL